MSRPSVNPVVWASDTNFIAPGQSWNGTATKIAPSYTAQGFQPGYRPPAQHHNYTFNVLTRWAVFFKELDDALEFDGMNTCEGGLRLAGSWYVDGGLLRVENAGSISIQATGHLLVSNAGDFQGQPKQGMANGLDEDSVIDPRVAATWIISNLTADRVYTLGSATAQAKHGQRILFRTLETDHTISFAAGTGHGSLYGSPGVLLRNAATYNQWVELEYSDGIGDVPAQGWYYRAFYTKP